MNKMAFFIFYLLTLSGKAQFTFEHDYPSASTYSANQLFLINFELMGERYVKIDRGSKSISLYSLNHSLTKTISLNALQLGINTGWIDDVLYLSQNLFNLDTNIEFIYCADCSSPSQAKIWVYDETGAVLFHDTAGIPVRVNIPEQQYPIYNTSQGTKMILSYPNGHAKVWGLAGTLTTAVEQANQNLMQVQGLISNPAPNPSVGTIKISYTLPKDAEYGEIVFYDQQGIEVKRFKVDKTFDHLLISTSDVPAGTYYYQLQTNGKVSEAKKMVVVK